MNYQKFMERAKKDMEINEANEKFKKVKLTIEVPDSKYCFEYGGVPCEHYDNEGGHDSCDLIFMNLSTDGIGVRKDPKCAKLR